MSTVFLNFLVVLTNFCWGIWGILDKKALDRSSEQSVLLVQYWLALPECIGFILYVTFVDRSVDLNSQVLFWGALGSFTATLAMISYTVAMSMTEASFVLSITSAYPLIVQLLATVFLHEELVGMRLFGAALISAGVAAVGYSHTPNVEHTPADKRKILVCVIIATICWGVHGLFDKKAVQSGSPVAVMIARSAVDFFVFIVMFLVLKRKKINAPMSDKMTWLYCSLSASAVLIGYFASLVAMTKLSASYVIVITGCYPILMYVFALLFLKEKLNLLRLGGVFLVVAGGTMVQLTQSE